MLWLFAGVAWAGPSFDQLRLDAQAARQSVVATGVYDIEFTIEELARITKDGAVARRWEKLDGADRVLGLIWTDVPRDQLWVAIQDDDNWDGVVKGLTEQTLEGSTFGQKYLFQHINLPWPFADRQWVIEIVNNVPLVEESGGDVWERTWTPSDRRDCELIAEDAIWVEVNDGGWLLVQAAGGTILSYHARTVIGGALPDRAATRYAYSTLDNMLKEMVERGRGAADHYDANHKPLMRPDGTTIEAFK